MTPIPQSLARLEEILGGAEEPSLEEIAALGTPRELDFLLELALRTLLRHGPRERSGLRRLLATARRAAAAGIASAALPGALRALLVRLENDLHAAGAWSAEEPLWWSPLPGPSRIEALWDQLDRTHDAALHSPAPAALEEAFTKAEAAGFVALPDFLQADFTTELYRELEAFHRAGGLELERAGVGADGEISARRFDEVRYVDGLDPALLDSAPSLAVLVQWGRARLAPHLEPTGLQVHPPQCAMLARYPAPSGGYAPHLDNPGADDDNGRTLTLVIYLNAPGEECRGGELALWRRARPTSAEPDARLAPLPGSAVLFESRAIAHQVEPLAEGPARWALTFWLADTSRETAPALPPPPRLRLTDVLLPIPDPPLLNERLLFHELCDEPVSGRVVVRSTRSFRPRRPRIGVLATVYRGGADLDAWCAHHLALGADHLILVFDHLEEPAEQADAARQKRRYAAGELTVWAGSEVARERWPGLPKDRDGDTLMRLAPGGSSSYAISARQTLNASAVLQAARRGELGGEPLDWLIHLDADEWLYLEGPGRGGDTLGQHFAAAEAAGLKLLRYVNHELLTPPASGEPPRFKINPRLAAARLGQRGWEKMVAHLEMAPTDARPWFNGYHNGKSAVAVEAALAAAGMHSWALSGSATPAMRCLLAGPSVLHFHFASADAFRRKYRAIAAASIPEGERLFTLSPVEERAVELVRESARSGAVDAEIDRRLDELHASLMDWSPRDVEWLEAADLLLTPHLDRAFGNP